MLAYSSSGKTETSRRPADEVRRDDQGTSRDAPVRSLSPGEILFQKGDTRARLYRVEHGALCHHIHWCDGRNEIIELAFPRDIVGFGHLEAHISTAQAMVQTVVSFVAARDFECMLECDGQLAARVAAAADREFDCLRLGAIRVNQEMPAKRLASYLAALSYLSRPEGRDPTIIPDEITSGVVAEQLHMNIDSLTTALRDLEDRGLIARAGAGLRLVDIGALERFAGTA